MIDQDHKLGGVLRAAREAKGVDLTRVERDTKIRERYLSALEQGDYRELPGAVYTKGFLRNYGAYLGLDPEYLIDLYRLETSTTTVERPMSSGPPRPITVRRRRTFVVTPGLLVAAILTIMVGALIAWIGWQFVNFARTPELRVIEPAGDVLAHMESTITIRGITEASATVTVTGLTENPSATADARGNFEITVKLLPGSNQFSLFADDPVTNRRSETIVRRVNVVTDAEPSPSGSGVAVALQQPEADATLTGPVPVSGTAAPGEALELSAGLVTAPTPNFAVSDAGGGAVELEVTAPSTPEATSLTADAAGAFSGSLALGPGIWDVVVAPTIGEPVTRRVTVRPGDGLVATLSVAGGESYMEVEEDGVPVDGVSGTISQDGDRIELAADETIRILAGNAGAVRISINGIGLGVMGTNGAVIEWSVARSGD